MEEEEDWSSHKWAFEINPGWHKGYSWNCFSSGLTQILSYSYSGWLLSFSYVCLIIEFLYLWLISDYWVLKVRYDKQRIHWHQRIPGTVSWVWNRRGHYCGHYWHCADPCLNCNAFEDKNLPIQTDKCEELFDTKLLRRECIWAMSNAYRWVMT